MLNSVIKSEFEFISSVVTSFKISSPLKDSKEMDVAVILHKNNVYIYDPEKDIILI